LWKNTTLLSEGNRCRVTSNQARLRLRVLLLVMACVIALVDLGVKTPTRTVTYGLSLLTLAAVALLQGLYASTGATVGAAATMGSVIPVSAAMKGGIG